MATRVQTEVPGHGWSRQESPECLPPPDSTVPPALIPQPTHPRTLQSLEGNRSGETELREQAEPCCPSPTPRPATLPTSPSTHQVPSAAFVALWTLQKHGPVRGRLEEEPHRPDGETEARTGSRSHSLAPAVFLASPLHIPGVPKAPGFLEAR